MVPAVYSSPASQLQYISLKPSLTGIPRRLGSNNRMSVWVYDRLSQYTKKVDELSTKIRVIYLQQ